MVIVSCGMGAGESSTSPPQALFAMIATLHRHYLL